MICVIWLLLLVATNYIESAIINSEAFSFTALFLLSCYSSSG